MRGDLLPYMGAGTNALGQIGQMNSGDYSGFENSPDYVYAKQQAQYAIEHGAANAGSLYSGGTSLDLGREIMGLASQNLGNYRNSLMTLAGFGENAAAGVGNAGIRTAESIGGYDTNAGNAAAGGYLANGNNQANLLNQLGQIGANYYGGSGGSGSTSSSMPAANPVADLPIDDYNWA